MRRTRAVDRMVDLGDGRWGGVGGRKECRRVRKREITDKKLKKFEGDPRERKRERKGKDSRKKKKNELDDSNWMMLKLSFFGGGLLPNEGLEFELGLSLSLCELS